MFGTIIDLNKARKELSQITNKSGSYLVFSYSHGDDRGEGTLRPNERVELPTTYGLSITVYTKGEKVLKRWSTTHGREVSMSIGEEIGHADPEPGEKWEIRKENRGFILQKAAQKSTSFLDRFLRTGK